MGRIRVLEIGGTAYQMGFDHGQAYHDEIHKFTEERIHLSSDRNWTGHSLSRAEVLALGEACLAEHEAYAPQLMDEIRGMAAATGLSETGLIIMNGFTDFIDTVYNIDPTTHQPYPSPPGLDNCTAFLVPGHLTPDSQGFFGQTWDMHASATPYVIMLRGRPDGAPAFMAFTITGCVGMIGMNDAGIAIGINNIMSRDGQVGVTWPFIVRKALQQTTIDAALDCIVNAKRAGAHNYLIMDKSGCGYNVEAFATRVHVDTLAEQSLVHTNHCVVPDLKSIERERLPASRESSIRRLARGVDLLSETQITPEYLMQLTRDPDSICVRSSPPMHIETCGAAIMRPSSGDLWAVWGLPSENEYEHFSV